jgi:hypothetical protein
MILVAHPLDFLQIQITSPGGGAAPYTTGVTTTGTPGNAGANTKFNVAPVTNYRRSSYYFIIVLLTVVWVILHKLFHQLQVKLQNLIHQ